MGSARIVSIKDVTHVVPDLAAIEQAYGATLNYRVVRRDEVSRREAIAWDAPKMVGRSRLTLAPQIDEACFLHFIESASATGYRALTTLGWTATEIVVQDVDTLASRLAQSAFEIIGGPKGLTRFPMIRAMQAIGPAGECLYFTQVGSGSGLDLAPPRSFVGRVFIVVAGGRDADAMFDPYRGFANQIDPPVATPVTIISDANGLPPDTLHPHGLVRLDGGTMIELDGYPDVATPRACAPGELPPGMAVVAFAVDGQAAGFAPVTVRGRSDEVITFVPVAGGADATGD